eukprot:TRINITY_DN35375_c0_g1_i1.p2 TRINITY_DN35375_c0_g1~~TRINITY_DN35375_c0_g1_i1.p2  ORF type:complete len:187 (-),score=37.22 TRINITY_DN35375_c0_g1_i1:17-577(-)
MRPRVIDQGIMVLVGIDRNDTWAHCEYIARKLLSCKLFNGPDGKPWRKNVKDSDFGILLVSQFTLYGTLSKGPKPDFHCAMGGDPAREMFDKFVAHIRSQYKEDKVQTGQFGAMMDVALVNDGPVTLMLESPSDLDDKTRVKPSADPSSTRQQKKEKKRNERALKKEAEKAEEAPKETNTEEVVEE